ncbi:RagB/SusD family nutrient uptake outer membrane protein [Pedobacter insulae]|uniref:SusD family protein n=1 Tax=Pedobacter insulae TaxID=414048 RepID=A0A1I2ZIH3_9SPHI|nr:RagB/SusD family nutrient uptake outer membrane protein [Pedobacter insulae]SFH37652.1 SusD family protein [Pedobacter insulae]
MKLKSLIFGIIAICFCSCEKFLQIGPPKQSLVQSEIFKTDELATTAITGIYSQMALTGYASGNGGSISVITGLSADDLVGYVTTLNFYENDIPTTNTTITTLWQSPYKSIYSANAVLEGLSSPNGVSEPIKAQLRGEALFVRAFANFCLVNLFGPVPLNLNTDYRIMAVEPRSSVDVIYQQIVKDLREAEGLLPENYVTTERVRPNKSAVQALLARVYLYNEDWANADKYASMVIAKTATYKLVAYDDIFLKNSQEAIWQLVPTAGGNTADGSVMILTATPTFASLRPDFVQNAFEANDKRKAAWVRTYTNTTGTYYYPFKYKVKTSSTISEYSMIFRLAEQYLIRAEARGHLNQLSSAIDDIDQIRSRAGLSLIKNINPSISQSNLLQAIENERRVELFAEWGHRWFDIKRSGKADQILAPIKAKWQSTDQLYPIPSAEITRNKSLVQNKGY